MTMTTDAARELIRALATAQWAPLTDAERRNWQGASGHARICANPLAFADLIIELAEVPMTLEAEAIEVVWCGAEIWLAGRNGMSGEPATITLTLGLTTEGF